MLLIALYLVGTIATSLTTIGTASLLMRHIIFETATQAYRKLLRVSGERTVGVSLDRQSSTIRSSCLLCASFSVSIFSQIGVGGIVTLKNPRACKRALESSTKSSGRYCSIDQNTPQIGLAILSSTFPNEITMSNMLNSMRDSGKHTSLLKLLSKTILSWLWETESSIVNRKSNLLLFYSACGSSVWILSYLFNNAMSSLNVTWLLKLRPTSKCLSNKSLRTMSSARALFAWKAITTSPRWNAGIWSASNVWTVAMIWWIPWLMTVKPAKNVVQGNE